MLVPCTVHWCEAMSQAPAAGLQQETTRVLLSFASYMQAQGTNCLAYDVGWRQHSCVPHG
jgi:hypothetical protein